MDNHSFPNNVSEKGGEIRSHRIGGIRRNYMMGMIFRQRWYISSYWDHLYYNGYKFKAFRFFHGPLASYAKLRVAHASGMPGTFSPPPRVSNPVVHHGTCVTHVPWCMPGSVTSGFLWSRWRGKRSRHSRRMCNPQFYVSGKRPIGSTNWLWRSRSVNPLFIPLLHNLREALHPSAAPDN